MTTYAPRCWPNTAYDAAAALFPTATASAGAPVSWTTYSTVTSLPDPGGGANNQNVAVCGANQAVVAFCPAGGHDDDCKAQFANNDGWSNIYCANVPAGMTQPDIVSTTGIVTCYTPDDVLHGGSLNVGCPPDSVLVGLGSSGDDPTSMYDRGLSGVRVNNNALCGALSDAYVLDRSNSTYVTVNDLDFNSPVRCPADMVATAFCKGQGGDATCTIPTTGVAMHAWLRCDTVRASSAAVFPPADVTPSHCAAAPSATDAGTACAANRTVGVALTCPGGGCTGASPIKYGSDAGQPMQLNPNYQITTTPTGTTLTRSGDAATARPFQCGTCAA
jgi:hypothetical protein